MNDKSKKTMCYSSDKVPATPVRLPSSWLPRSLRAGCSCWLAWLLVFSTAVFAFAAESPRAESGKLDLSGRDFVADGPLELNGAWEFYWQQLLEPGDFSPAPPTPDSYLAVPSGWQDCEINGEPVGSEGFATLRLTLNLPPQTQQYALWLREIPSSYRLWVDDREIAVGGKVGNSATTEIPRLTVETISFAAAGRLDLTLQISNYHFRDGGLPQPIRFGLTTDLVRQQALRRGFDQFIVGSLLAMGLYHLLLYLLRRRERASLLLGIYCLLWGSNALVSATNDYFAYTLWPDFPWPWLYRVDMITYITSVPIICTYFFYLYPKEGSKPLLRLCQALGLTFALFTLFGELRFVQHALELYHLISATAVLYCCLMIIRALRNKRDGALLMLTGSLILGITAFNDILRELNLIQTPFLITLGLLLFIACQAVVLARRFSHALDAAEHLNVELERNLRLRQELEHRQETELELQRGQRRLEILLDGVDSVLLAVNDCEEISFCNRAGEALLEKSADELLGTPVWDLLTKESHPILQRWFDPATTATDERPDTVLLQQGLNGHIVPVHVSVTKVEFDDEELFLLNLSPADALNQPSPATVQPLLEQSLPGADSSVAEDAGSNNVLQNGAKARCGVELLRLSLDCWQAQTGQDKFALARSSRLWKVYTNRDGWARTQTLDRYLDVNSLPLNPRCKLFSATADFVLSTCLQNDPLRQRLQTLRNHFEQLTE